MNAVKLSKIQLLPSENKLILQLFKVHYLEILDCLAEAKTNFQGHLYSSNDVKANRLVQLCLARYYHTKPY